MPHETECACGSGLPFSHCHGDSRNEYARLQALQEAESVALLFPAVRARGIDEVVAHAAERAVSDELPDGLIDDVLAEIGSAERRRVVDLWAAPYADRWESLVAAAGDSKAAELAVLKGAVRAAIAERQATPHDVVAPLDDERYRPTHPAALALVIPPELVWSIDEARAGVAAADGRKAVDKMKSVEVLAFALMSFEHVRRTRTLANRLSGELPFPEFAAASRLLAEACADVEERMETARAATAALLIAYAHQVAVHESARFG